MRNRVWGLVGVLIILSVASCDDSSYTPNCEGVFYSEGSQQVLAALRLCAAPMLGFPWNFSQYYGSTAAYLYTDGSLIYRDPSEPDSGPTLPFRKVLLSNEQYCELVAGFSLAGLEQEADSGWFTLTEASDVRSTEVFLRVEGKELEVTMYGNLFNFEEWYMADDYESVAPNAIALARGLKKLSTGGQLLESNSIQVVGVILTEDSGSETCPSAGAVEWPFANIALADYVYQWDSAGGQGVTLAGQQAKEVRDWWVAEAESPPCTRVFAKVDATAYEVFLTEVPPGGREALPFLPCPGGGH